LNDTLSNIKKNPQQVSYQLKPWKQLNPPHKKSILEDSYINHDILSSYSPFRQFSISLTLNFRQHNLTSQISLAYYSSQLLLSSTSISESQEIISTTIKFYLHRKRSNHHQIVSRNTYLYI